MFTKEQSVELVDSMGSDLTIVNAARVSFGTQKAELEPKDNKLIKYLADNKHMSPFEHCITTFIIKTPIYISKQIMRHRTFSYNEISRRYTSKDIQFYIPPVFRKQATNNRQASEGQVEEKELVTDTYKRSIVDSLDSYASLLDGLHVCREQARGVLPQCTMTEFYMTGNLRNWSHFINLRLPKDAQGEIQEIARLVKTELEKIYPISLKALENDE